jgi:hypothetical protein
MLEARLFRETRLHEARFVRLRLVRLQLRLWNRRQIARSPVAVGGAGALGVVDVGRGEGRAAAFGRLGFSARRLGRGRRFSTSSTRPTSSATSPPISVHGA